LLAFLEQIFPPEPFVCLFGKSRIALLPIVSKSDDCSVECATEVD